MRITRRIPREQYGYYEIEFESIAEYTKEFKSLKKEIEKQESKDDEDKTPEEKFRESLDVSPQKTLSKEEDLKQLNSCIANKKGE